MRLGVTADRRRLDDTLAQELRDAPALIRAHGALLEFTALGLNANQSLDGAVRVYERLVSRAADGKNRTTYAQPGANCNLIRATRRLQGREGVFNRYYQELFATCTRYPALKDELQRAIEGPGYARWR